MNISPSPGIVIENIIELNTLLQTDSIRNLIQNNKSKIKFKKHASK